MDSEARNEEPAPLFSSALARMQARIEEERRWEAENPQLAADWDMALAEEERRQEERARAWHAKELAERAPRFLEACGVGPLHAEVALRTDLKATPALDAVQRFLASDTLFLLIHGGCGAGKTVAAVKALLSEHRSTAWGWDDPDSCAGQFVSADMLARMSYFDLEKHKRLCRARLLVVDDVGVEQSSSTFLAGLDGLLNERMSHKRRTILSTNLGLEEFKARFAKPGSRLASRFAQHGMVAGVGNEDLRRASRGTP